jgi:hypothetical protein
VDETEEAVVAAERAAAAAVLATGAGATTEPVIEVGRGTGIWRLVLRSMGRTDGGWWLMRFLVSLLVMNPQCGVGTLVVESSGMGVRALPTRD